MFYIIAALFLMGNWLIMIFNTYLGDMLDTMVDINITDKEKSIVYEIIFLSCYS